MTAIIPCPRHPLGFETSRNTTSPPAPLPSSGGGPRPQAPAAVPQATAPQAAAVAVSSGGGGAPPVERLRGGEGFRGGTSWEAMRTQVEDVGRHGYLAVA
jgi:hypothetical protein